MRQKNKSDTGSEPEVRASDQQAAPSAGAGQPDNCAAGAAGSGEIGTAEPAHTTGTDEMAPAAVSETAGPSGAVAASDAAADPADLSDMAHSADSDADGRLQAELRELGDRHMRLMAEYDNFRRRARQEKEQIYDVTVGDVAADWLPVIDNLERALAAREQSASTADDQILQGIDMVYRQALQVLEKYGVQPIEALGQTFDPNLHAAVLHIDDSAYGDGEIVEVFEKGYIRDGRVLRHSVVKVAN